MVVSSFAIGALAVPVFKLGFVDSALAIIFVNLLATAPACIFSTFGPKFGLRQMVLSRFFFGYYGVKLGESCSIYIFSTEPHHDAGGLGRDIKRSLKWGFANFKSHGI